MEQKMTETLKLLIEDNERAYLKKLGYKPVFSDEGDDFSLMHFEKAPDIDELKDFKTKLLKHFAQQKLYAIRHQLRANVLPFIHMPITKFGKMPEPKQLQAFKNLVRILLKKELFIRKINTQVIAFYLNVLKDFEEMEKYYLA